MKKEFSNHWKNSTQKRKQRKYRYNAPLNIKRKFLSVHLLKDLRQKYNLRSLLVRKGDTVKVLRGDHRGKEGKVTDVNPKFCKVYVENIIISKKDGSKKNIGLEPSNLVITSLNLEDKMRSKRFSRVKSASKETETAKTKKHK